MSTAWAIIDLVEVNGKFRKRVADIAEEIALVAKAQGEEQVHDIEFRMHLKCDSLLEASQTKHPLLKLGRTA